MAATLALVLSYLVVFMPALGALVWFLGLMAE
jgi:hypothetical protein